MNSYENLNDEELILAIKSKYSQHLKEAEKYKRMLDAYNGISTGNNISHSNGTESVKKNEVTQKPKTFEETIMDIFGDGHPRSTSELLKEYSAKTGKQIKQKDFSSKLSIRARNGKLKNQEFKDFPLENRYWWGLSAWFEGSLFKPEMQLLIHEKYKEMIK